MAERKRLLVLQKQQVIRSLRAANTKTFTQALNPITFTKALNPTTLAQALNPITFIQALNPLIRASICPARSDH